MKYIEQGTNYFKGLFNNKEAREQRYMRELAATHQLPNTELAERYFQARVARAPLDVYYDQRKVTKLEPIIYACETVLASRAQALLVDTEPDVAEDILSKRIEFLEKMFSFESTFPQTLREGHARVLETDYILIRNIAIKQLAADAYILWAPVGSREFTSGLAQLAYELIERKSTQEAGKRLAEAHTNNNKVVDKPQLAQPQIGSTE